MRACLPVHSYIRTEFALQAKICWIRFSYRIFRTRHLFAYIVWRAVAIHLHVATLFIFVAFLSVCDAAFMDWRLVNGTLLGNTLVNKPTSIPPTIDRCGFSSWHLRHPRMWTGICNSVGAWPCNCVCWLGKWGKQADIYCPNVGAYA